MGVITLVLSFLLMIRLAIQPIRTSPQQGV
jgi:hypothetical protein